MVAKSYLRYVEGPDSGVVTSNASNTMAILPKIAAAGNNNNKSQQQMLGVTASLEYVSIYDLQSGQLLDRLCPKSLELGSTAEVTAVTSWFSAQNSTSNNNNTSMVYLGVGYANGAVSMWTGNPNGNNSNRSMNSSSLGGPSRFGGAGSSSRSYSSSYGVPAGFGSASTSADAASAATSAASSGYQWSCVFYGQSHKPDTAVLSVCLDVDGGRMLSSGQDTDITVWDLSTHEPLYRLCGHRGAVVNAVFIPAAPKSSHKNNATAGNKQSAATTMTSSSSSSDYILSGSADGLVKVWDLSVQSCIETIVASDTQVTTICIDKGGQRVFVGVRDDHVKVFSIHLENALKQQQEQVSSSTTTTGNIATGSKNILVAHGLLRRKTNKPPTSISFSLDDRLLIVCTAQNVELYRVLSSEDVQKKVARKLRRRKEVEKRSRQQQQTSETAAATLKKRKVDGAADENENQNDEAEAVATKTASALTEEFQRTVNEEILPLRLYTAGNVDASLISQSSTDGHNNHKLRCTLLLPIVTSASTTNNNTAVRFLVAANDNTLSIMESIEQEAPQQQNNNENENENTPTVMGDWKKIRSDIGGVNHPHQHEVRRLVFDSQDMQLASVSYDCVKLWFISNAAADRNEARMDQINQEAWDDGNEEQRNLSRLVCACTFPMRDLHTMCVNEEVARAGFYSHLEGTYSSSSNLKKNAMSFRATNVCFLPGDDLIAISTMEGRLIVCAVSTNSVVSVVNAHSSQINDFISSMNADWFISCGKDRKVTKWQVALNNNSTSTTKRVDPLTCTTLEASGDEVELNEIPLTLRFVPPNDEIVAVALQDFTVHLYYCDTFKPFLTLYGHKLPVSSIDFSKDGQLCSTVGMDKSLRFWGTDFGDCHRSIHAHDNYANGVSFLGNTHYVVTVSLDGSIKFWDGDTWQLIQQFHVHQRGLLCVTSNKNGTCVATAGSDRNIRVLFRTEEMLFPEEELQQQAQKAADAEMARKSAMKRLDQVEVGDVGVVGQKTVATAEAAEHLMAALDAVSVELQRRSALASGEITGNAPFEMGTQDPYVYFWKAIEQVKPSQLRHALSSITQTHMHSLLQFLVGAVAEGAVQDYEVASRVVLALVKPAPGSNSNPALLFPDPKEAHRVLANLGEQIEAGLKRDTDRVAVNVAGLDFMLNRLEGQRKITVHDRTKIQGAARKFSNVELKTALEDE